ncbi:hypothetical protein GKC68_03850 [Pantoea sp. RSPAM1]
MASKPAFAVGVEASFVAESAQSPERTDVREEDEHLAAAKMASKPGPT